MSLNKMLFTERGLELKQQLLEEKHYENFLKNKMVHQRKMSVVKNEESGNFFDQMNRANSTKNINNSITKELNPLNLSKSKSISQLILSQIDKDQITPYLQKQTTRISEGLAEPMLQKHQQLKSRFSTLNNSSGDILLNINGTPSLSHNDSLNHSNQPVRSSAYSKNESVESINNQENYLDKYNQIIHAQARVERMLKKYEIVCYQQDEIKQKVKNEFQRKEAIASEVNQKPPKMLNEFQSENKNMYDSLFRKTKFAERQHTRILGVLEKKYKPSWSQIQLPKLTDKYQDIKVKYYYPHLDYREQPEEISGQDSGKSDLHSIAISKKSQLEQRDTQMDFITNH